MPRLALLRHGRTVTATPPRDRKRHYRFVLDAYAPPVEDEDRQWEAIKAVTHDFIGLPRAEAEGLAAGLGLHPFILDWDVLGRKTYVQLPWTTGEDTIVLHVEGGAKPEPRAAPHPRDAAHAHPSDA